MIGQASLGVVIGADTLAAVTRADLCTALARDLSLLRGALDIKQLRAQHLQGLIAVFELTALLLAFDHDARGLMREAHGGFGLVYVLTARTAALTGFQTSLHSQIRSIV